MTDYSSDKLDARLNQLERKLDDLNTRLAATGEQDMKRRHRSGATRADRTFWGAFLIVLGGLWLSERMHWIDISAAWLWPVLVVAFGLYLIIGGRNR